MTSARICGIAFPKNDALTLFEAFAADKSAIFPDFTVKKFLPVGICEHQRDAKGPAVDVCCPRIGGRAARSAKP
jgi:hypothetical protein